MPEKPIRVGLIGAGGNTKAFHIPGFKKQDGVEIAAVANRSRKIKSTGCRRIFRSESA